MPKYLVDVTQTIAVKITVHAANPKLAAKAAEHVVKGWSKTVDATAQSVKELGDDGHEHDEALRFGRRALHRPG